MTIERYLARHYIITEKPDVLPLPDEAFISLWKETDEEEALKFLADAFHLPVDRFPLQNPEGIQIRFAATLGGRLPVIYAGCHADFCSMEALIDGRDTAPELPLTVNAFTIVAQAPTLLNHRLILLGSAPYSNVSASALGLDDADWLRRSTALRLAHECAHYETLRLFGGMRNHALDEIVADTMGQLAAFGSFSAQRQRLFFGLTAGSDTCTGRLTFYCKILPTEDQAKVYKAVDRVLNIIEEKVNALCKEKASHYDILAHLAGTSIAELAET